MIEPATGMHFIRPLWLLWALPAVLVAWLLWRQRLSNGDWSRVIDQHLLQYLAPKQQTAKGRFGIGIILLAWVFAAIAAAGPSLKQIPQPVEQIEDALVLVLDLSYSMKAADQAPSRIDRARQKLLDLLQEREEGQTGLVAYAGDAHVVTPLTDDTATIANLLPALNPDMMPLPGSSTSAAITLALDLLQSAGVKGGRILLVTDGIPEAEASRVRQLLQGSPNRLAILGVGTRNGAPMPLPRGGFVRDDSNAIVMPGLEEAALEDLAAATGGQYRRLQVDDRDLTALLAQLPSVRQTRVDDNRSADTWEDQGYWLILALLPIALALFRRGWLLGLVPMMLPIMLPLTLLLAPAPAQADAWRNLWLTPDQQAQQALAAGDAETAAELFEDPNWKATAAYSSGDYAQAVSLFSEQETADGWYNRGNALARSGDLKGASDAYRKALELDPEQADAQANLKLVEDLQRQQEQEEEQSGPPEQGEDNEPSNEQGKGDSADPSDSEQDSQQDGEQNQEPPDDPGKDPAGNPRDPSQGNEPEAGASDEEPRSAPEPESPQQPEPAPAPGALENVPVPELSLEEAERNQAMEQWLRRVPDDPSGLLREKFRYESLKRQQQSGTSNDIEW